MSPLSPRWLRKSFEWCKITASSASERRVLSSDWTRQSESVWWPRPSPRSDSKASHRSPWCRRRPACQTELHYPRRLQLNNSTKLLARYQVSLATPTKGITGRGANTEAFRNPKKEQAVLTPSRSSGPHSCPASTAPQHSLSSVTVNVNYFSTQSPSETFVLSVRGSNYFTSRPLISVPWLD